MLVRPGTCFAYPDPPESAPLETGKEGCARQYPSGATQSRVVPPSRLPVENAVDTIHTRWRMCLSRAVAEALLPASQHIWRFSTSQRTQNPWEGTTQHSHFWGCLLMPRTAAGLHAWPRCRSDTPGPAWAGPYLTPSSRQCHQDCASQTPPALAGYSAIGM